jgi:DNA topoisomerase-2
MSKSKQTIEEKYKKLTQREHCLLRSGMYIGDIKKNNEELWVMDKNKMTKRFVEYSPGFLKIFDEVLSNATDHAIRDKTVTTIKVNYSKETGEICVWNNGTGVPVELHKEQNMYVPELIFGHLLSGSNYDDTQDRTVVGTNGLGSKVTNIFSKKFVVETVDSENKKKFIQEFTDNMENKSKPKITNNSSKSYTKITFIPDYKKFSMKCLEEDTCLLLNKRVYDCIACTGSNMQIHLNGEKLKGKSFTDYTKYFFEDSKVISEQSIQRNKGNEMIWEYAIIPHDNFEQISFVNGNATNQGGKHVDYILYQIVNKLKEMLETKKKLKDVKPSFIKDRLFLFLRSTVINPTFNSQTKEMLTTQSKDFGCKVEVSDGFINKIYKSSIIEEIVEFCKLKESAKLSKDTDGKKVSKIYIPKLEDAINAGTSKSKECTLILTEGDSAATFAKWGRAIIGPENYAVFPLKGKCLNVRDASTTQLINNEELNNIKQILGLKQNKEYTNTNDLRYGKVMILTDSDVDGSHIKSLFVNFMHAQWPSLIKLNPSFIQTVRTPIVKAIKGKKVLEFFTEQDYDIWKKSNDNKSGYQIRYFKGLGTSKKEDAQDTFRRINELKMDYYYKDANCDKSILLAFEKDKNINTKIKADKKNKKNRY